MAAEFDCSVVIFGFSYAGIINNSGNATIDENGTVSVIGAGEIKIKVIKAADTEYTEAEATVIFHVIKKDTPCDDGDSCTSHTFSDLSTSALYATSYFIFQMPWKISQNGDSLL